jgi:hypothetical protein
VSRFLAGLGLGAITGACTYAVTQAQPWWWAIGGLTALTVWAGPMALDALGDLIDDLF